MAAELSAASGEIVSLAGEWGFGLDRSAEQTELRAAHPLPEGDGIKEEWFKRDLPDKINLPGVLQAQGHGNEISPGTPWVLGLGDAWWKLQPAALRGHFSQPGKVEVPFLSQPPRHYLGVAWYQREIEVSPSWKNRRVALYLERPHWETRVWVDGVSFGSNNSLVAPHIYDLGELAAGKHKLSIRIDNRRLLVDSLNDGHAVDSHSVSDALGASWNGIAGRIELSATTKVWIDDAQVFPDFATTSALIKVKIGNATGHSGSGRLAVGKTTVGVKWNAEGGEGVIKVKLGSDVRTWDEFHPNLQQLTVSLSGTDASDSKTITFGIRHITHRDTDILINGHSVNLRTTHSGGDFPLTGYPATDVESWKKIIKVCQAYGVNGIRFHSWCPPEAAFTAADELGFYLQPECGLWSPFNPGSIYTRFLEEETARLLKAFGNHPSFLLLSPSNEPAGRYEQVTPQWAVDCYEKDNRRLYSAGTGWGRAAQVTGGAQFATLVEFNGTHLRNSGGWFGKDYRAGLEGIHIPVLAHEVGQWCAYPDFDIISKFTGYMRPSNYNIFKYIAAQEGVLPDNREFVRASGRFQLECYKEEIEANLRTPGLAGYQLLDLHDYLGQGTALIGVLDAFWDPKSYVTGEEFSRFNSATVTLARLHKRIFTTAEKLESEVELYHFGEKPIVSAKPYWKITDAAKRVVAQGEWEARDIPIGKNIPLGKVSMTLAQLSAPKAYKLVVGIADSSIENDWNFWLYPAQADKVTPEDVLVTSDWRAAEARLAQSGKVLFTPRESDLDLTRCPPLKKVPVFWNIQMTVRPPRNRTPRFDAMLGLLCDVKHPALAKFPTEENCDWQWTPIIQDVRAINLSSAPRELRPIVAAIDDWNRNWRLGVIFECRVGTGRLLVSAIPLTGSISADQLRASLVTYIGSDQFQPSLETTSDVIKKLWRQGVSAAPSASPRVFDPDLNDGAGSPPR